MRTAVKVSERPEEVKSLLTTSSMADMVASAVKSGLTLNVLY
jgi:hypothetical protein